MPEAELRASPPRVLFGFALHYLQATAVVVLCTLACRPMRGRFDSSNLIMVYLLGVAYVAVRHGQGPSALAACLSVAAFDFFFVPPYLTFAVSDKQYVLTFAVMLAVGLLISTLAVRVREQAESAKQREGRTRVLYAMTRDLAGLQTADEIVGAASRHVADVFRGPATVLLAGPEGRIAVPANDAKPDAQALHVAVTGSRGALGVLAVRPDPSLLPLSAEQRDLLENLARQVAAPLERARLAGEIEEARFAAESERLRSALLSSVSHDLRTPLSAITGAATSLLQQASLAEGTRRELIETISEESERLSRLVTNLLDMTRLESGSVRLHREWHPVEEVVGSALARLDRSLAGRHVQTDLPANLPLVSMDAVLVEQVLVNLVENALKYAGPESPVRIAARHEAAAVAVEVADEGPGLPPQAEERVFDKFYRGPSGQRGFGLGLAICRAIVTAHGGRISAENRAPRGAVFRFTLPVDGTPPPLVPEETAEREDP